MQLLLVCENHFTPSLKPSRYASWSIFVSCILLSRVIEAGELSIPLSILFRLLLTHSDSLRASIIFSIVASAKFLPAKHSSKSLFKTTSGADSSRKSSYRLKYLLFFLPSSEPLSRTILATVCYVSTFYGESTPLGTVSLSRGGLAMSQAVETSQNQVASSKGAGAGIEV